MNTKLLLPNKFKKVGLILLVPSFLLFAFTQFADGGWPWLSTGWGKEFWEYMIDLQVQLLGGAIAGLLIIAFSREKQEDEYINSVRLESLQWAVLINYIFLIAATFLVEGLNFIDVMGYNMLTVLIIFIVRFHLVLGKNRVKNQDSLENAPAA